MNLALTLYAGVLAHFLGDYVFQSSWMASAKTKGHFPALCHVFVYGLVFLVLTKPSLAALAFIVGTHFVIDRYRLARHVCWARNWLAPVSFWWDDEDNLRTVRWNPPWAECQKTGSPPTTPDFIAFWMMVIVDQCLHFICNTIALLWL